LSQPLVYTVILNTNRRDDTLECIASLNDNSYERNTILVLDNQSSDGSVEAIHARFPQVKIIDLETNRGYAGNNNVGIAYALDQGADWIFVLNEDTVLAPDSLEMLVKAGESDPEIGIVGPMVYHYHTPDVIQSAGGVLGPYWDSIHLGRDQKDRGQYSEIHEVEWISGCAILLRREAILQAGSIDERFFYFWEETEWCIRIRRANWKIINVPQAKLWHKGVTVDHKPKPTVTYYATRNHLLTLAKHHAPFRVWASAWVQLLRTLTSWTIKPRWRNMHEHRDAMWYGIVDFLHGRWGQMPNRS